MTNDKGTLALTEEARQQLRDGDFGAPSTQAYVWVDALCAEIDALLAQDAARGLVVAACTQCTAHHPRETESVEGWTLWKCRHCGNMMKEPLYYQRVPAPPQEG